MEVNKAILIVGLTKEAEIHNVRETINQYKHLIQITNWAHFIQHIKMTHLIIFTIKRGKL